MKPSNQAGNGSRLSEIRNILFGCTPDPKMKFVVKLWRILQFTSKSPNDIQYTGAIWCSDGYHFIVNAQILATFLDLRPNTINTNFRTHFFRIVDKNSLELLEEFKSMQLSDLKNWSKRYNTHYQFTRETTEEEAFSIPIDECRPSYNLIPSKTANILIDEDILRRLQTLMEREIKEMSNEWKLKFLYLATRDWIQFSPPNATEVKSSDFIQAIFENTDDSECQKNWELIECNINDLLFGSSGSSQYSGTVTFIGFVEFELRFGFLNQIAKSVFEISYNVNGDDGFHNFTPTNACCSDELFEYILDPSPPSSPSIISPCYAPWFLPSVDLNTSTNYMNQKRIHWLVKMSSNYKNCFTLIKRGSGPNKFMGTYIIFDPLASDKQTLLSEAKGSYIKAPDWKTMICKFNLKFPSMQGYPVERMTLMRVTADIMINDEDETDNGENNEIDFPIF